MVREMCEKNDKTVASRAFGADARLRSRAQMNAVRAGGIKLTGRYSIVILLKTPPDANRRAAFLISRRFDLLSVVRNRARRLYRETFRRIYPDLPPCWILFIPKRNIKGRGLNDVMPEIRHLIFEAFDSDK